MFKTPTEKEIVCFNTGVILRDSHGVAQVRYITGNKILRILKAKGTYICY